MELVDRITTSWQVRALRVARGIDGAVILSVLAHAYDEQLIPYLLAAIGSAAVRAPFICSAAKIDKRGRVCADVVTKDEEHWKMQPLYETEIAFRDAMRRLADRLRLDDDERTELFDLARKWVVADTRLDPTMARNDPDAKRLVEGVTNLAHAPDRALH